MAFNRAFVILTVVATIFLKITSAKEIIVGDQAGWTINFDYQSWAKGKDFRVGDKLVFKYPVGVHNVFKVNGTAFQSCTVPPVNEALTSGNDTIFLATPGRKWYICGKPNHCQKGQKLFITVQPQAESPSWVPTRPPSLAPAQPPSWTPAQSPSLARAQPLGWAPAQPSSWTPAAQPSSWTPAQPPSWARAQPLGWAPAQPSSWTPAAQPSSSTRAQPPSWAPTQPPSWAPEASPMQNAAKRLCINFPWLCGPK